MFATKIEGMDIHKGIGLLTNPQPILKHYISSRLQQHLYNFRQQLLLLSAIPICISSRVEILMMINVLRNAYTQDIFIAIHTKMCTIQHLHTSDSGFFNYGVSLKGALI